MTLRPWMKRLETGAPPVIDLYTWTTPNGRKVSILLEELGLPYEAHAVDIERGEQFAPEFLAISPNNKIPAIRDRTTGFTLMESGAILIWLAERHGRFLPSGEERWRTIEWLMWQMGGFGPMIGQAHHFLYPSRGKSAYAEERYRQRGAAALRRARRTTCRAGTSWPARGGASTRSPTWRSGPGCRASSGTR
jgi:glutathione S-transferase